MRSSWNVLDASKLLQPAVSAHIRASRCDSSPNNGPLTPSKAIRCPFGSALLFFVFAFLVWSFFFCFEIRRPNPAAQPCQYRFGVEFRPRSALARHKHLPDGPVLLVNRLPRVHLQKLEDLGQCLIFLNHTANELEMALVRVGDVGDVLPRR